MGRSWTFWIALVIVSAVGLGSSAAEDTVTSPNAQLPYLGLDGTFTIDTSELAATDPRNPKRVVFRQMETVSFYDDIGGTSPIAENCRYTYRGAAGDPYFYPQRSKASIWDQLELVGGGPPCERFSYVIVRSPHGNPTHMHMRYGDTSTSFSKLLAISNIGPEDKTKLDPWWSVYCVEGVTGCDR